MLLLFLIVNKAGQHDTYQGQGYRRLTRITQTGEHSYEYGDVSDRRMSAYVHSTAMWVSLTKTSQ